MVTVFVHCPRCHSDKVYRHGLSPTKRECSGTLILAT
ncbi:IS1 family transposase [Symbiopectobacterium sp. Eva_TO]